MKNKKGEVIGKWEGGYKPDKTKYKKNKKGHTLYDKDGNPIDSGVVLFFKGPNSFTGEDVLELQAHGNPIILTELISRSVELGARQARPGEFSERAFRNGKIDLDLIEKSFA